MDSQTLLCKTARGQNEIARRELLQSRVMRNVLLLVDGKRDVRDLQQMMQALCAPPDALEQLLDLGLIAALPETAPPAPAAGEPAADAPVADEPAADGLAETAGNSALPPELDIDTRVAPETADSAADFASLYQQLNALVSTHLGMIKAYGLQLKIEQCQTADDLLALLPDIKAALAARHGEAQAIALLRQLGA
jgi:hypothetical protein